jgi:hypothetical protein
MASIVSNLARSPRSCNLCEACYAQMHVTPALVLHHPLPRHHHHHHSRVKPTEGRRLCMRGFRVHVKEKCKVLWLLFYLRYLFLFTMTR